jgi:hypothetical protein
MFLKIKSFKCEPCDRLFHRQTNLAQHKLKYHLPPKEVVEEVNTSDPEVFQQKLKTVELSMEANLCKAKPIKVPKKIVEEKFIKKIVADNSLGFSLIEDLDEQNCRICDQSFPDQPKLINHMWEVHEQKCFKCDLCYKSFGKRKAATDHLSRY